MCLLTHKRYVHCARALFTTITIFQGNLVAVTQFSKLCILLVQALEMYTVLPNCLLTHRLTIISSIPPLSYDSWAKRHHICIQHVQIIPVLISSNSCLSCVHCDWIAYTWHCIIWIKHRFQPSQSSGWSLSLIQKIKCPVFKSHPKDNMALEFGWVSLKPIAFSKTDFRTALKTKLHF